MKKTRFFVFISLIILLLFSNIITAYSQEKIAVNFFHSESCSHCAVIKDIFAKYNEQYPDFKENVVINYREMNENNNREYIKSFYDAYNVPTNNHGKVPIVFIGNKYILGEKTFEQEFLVYYNTYLDKRELYNNEFAPIKEKIQEISSNNPDIQNTETKNEEKNKTIPLLVIIISSLNILFTVIYRIKKQKGMR